MWKLLILTGIILALISSAKGCTELTASVGFTQSFDSHPNYGYQNYPNSYDECWIITAPSGYVLEMYTDSGFHLESSCSYDSLLIECGDDGDDGEIGEYCGTNYISSFSPVYSDDESVRVTFETDSSVGYDGFTFFYVAVLPEDSNGGDCEDTSEEEPEVNVGLAIGIIIVIVMLVVVLPIVIVIVIVVVVVCMASQSGRRRGQVYPSTFPQTVVYRGNQMHQPTGAMPAAPSYSTATATHHPPVYTGHANSSFPPPPGIQQTSYGMQNQPPPVYGMQSNPGAFGAEKAPPPVESVHANPQQLTMSHGTDANGVPSAAIYQPPHQ